MKYKVIKSLAHNTGHSFVSDMNWAGNDYVMSHLARAAVATGIAELRVDLLTGEATPLELVTDPVRESIEERRRWFSKHAESHGVNPIAVSAATMTIQFAVERQNYLKFSGWPDSWELPFRCVVTIDDDRGGRHQGVVAKWWTVHPIRPLLPPRRRWWQFWKRSAE